MPVTYAPFDLGIINHVLRLNFQIGPDVAAGVLGLPAQPTDHNIEFQFPPKILGDSRKGTWDDQAGGPTLNDVISVYKSPGPRRISLKWQYIVDGSAWPASRIRKQLQVLRGYFIGPSYANPVAGQTVGVYDSLVILVNLWSLGGVPLNNSGVRESMTFRLEAVNIKHGETLVNNQPGNDLLWDIFPLQTEVSLELVSYARVQVGAHGNSTVSVAAGQTRLPISWF